MGQRLLGGNALMDSLNSLVPSSEEPTLPATFITDQLRQKPWRTLSGWTVVAGFNDRLDWSRGGSGPFAAVIPTGTYSTGAALATAIQTAMNTADGGSAYEVTYNVAAANRFRIRDINTLNIVLKWVTGANAARSIGIDLGYNTGSDSGSASSHTAAVVSYQSRHYLTIHRSPSADVPVIGANAAVLLEHTATIIGSTDQRSVVTIQSNAIDSWAAPSFSLDFVITDGLTSASDACVVYFFATVAHEYFRLLIDDVQNPIGYFELGILYLGIYVEPARKIEAPALSNDPDDFSAVETGIDGTHFVDEHRSRDRLSLAWKAATPPDQVILRDFFGALHAGEDFLFDLDPTDTEILYGFVAGRPKEQYLSTLLVTFGTTFFEAL